MSIRLVDLDELLEYCNYMNDEYGEYCLGLYSVGQRIDMMNREFLEAYVKEMNFTLDNIRKNTKWTNKKETVINEYKELEWLSDV